MVFLTCNVSSLVVQFKEVHHVHWPVPQGYHAQRIHKLPVNFPHPIFSQPNLTPDSKHPLTSFLLSYILCLLNTWLLLRLLSSYTEGIHLRSYCVGCTLDMNTQLGNSWHLVFSYESHKMLERSDQRLQDCLKGR